MSNKLIGISSKLISEEEGESYWCTTKQMGCNPGDLLLIYIKGKGINQLFTIIKIEKDDHIKCLAMGMKTIYLKHVHTFSNPLPTKILKTDPKYSNISVVRKNFQGTTFQLDEDEWETILNGLITNNLDFLSTI